MDQEEPLDFQTLRAKFQNEELPLKPPKEKPVLPEKPKVAPPPPQSPTHHLPTGARSTFLATINDNLERKTLFAPRVVFKDDKESKKPLIHSNSKGKDKSVGKLKAGKDKTFKGSRENLLEDLVDQKKENGKDKMLPFVFPVAQKASTAELVPATPPPKATVPKKKVLLGFKKSKKDSLVISADPILDAPSLSVPGPAPLIPLPSEFGSASQEPEISAPESLLPENPTLSDYSAVAEIIPPSTAPESPDFNPPPPIIPDNFATEIPSPNSETPPGIESPALPVSIPDNQNEIIPSPPSVCPPPPPVCAITGPPAVVSAPSPSEPENTAESGNDIIYIAALEKPPAQAVNPPSNPPSPKAERPISALSALERAEDMSAGKKTSPGDQRIFNALQKARRKTTSPLTNPTPSYSVTPPPEEHSPPQSPTHGLPELPPIDYEDRIGSVLPPKPAQVNGINHRQPSPLLEEITERPDPVPELLEVPRPPPRKTISDVGPPEESVNNPSVNLSQFIPPPQLEDNAIPALHQFSETSTPDVPEVDNVASDVHFPDLPASEWEPEEHTAPDVPDGQNLQLFHNNGITVQETDAHTESSYEGINPLPKSSLPVSQGLPAAAEPQADDIYHNAENVYEYVSTSDGKSKVKTKTGKKQKGQPKNPYVETAQETLQTQEKSKTGRFGKSEKKAAAEGPDEKEMKKKEKQRLEKEKKELKEKQEREKKEQKEREKKENELKKKFKITGQEEAMYQATVVVTTKGRKNDLPVKTGDIVGIIRTTNCPKGKWLARDSSNNYGYVAVDHVELDIKEMIGMGKKTLKKSNNNLIESDANGTDSRVSNHYQLPSESFTDDSEEWTGDEEPASPEPDTANPLVPLFPLGHTRTFSMPDMGNKDLNINHQHSRSDMTTGNSQIQTQHEAIQKLTTFFQSSVKPAESTTEPEMSYAARPALVMEEANIPTEPKTSYAAGPALVNEEAFHMPEASSTQETDFSPDKIILPPPDMYADGLE